MPTAAEWFEPTNPNDEQFPPAKTTVERLADERNALRDEVAELKRKVADVTSQRDALRAEIDIFIDLYADGYKFDESVLRKIVAGMRRAR